MVIKSESRDFYQKRIEELKVLFELLMANIFRLFGPVSKRYKDNKKKIRIAVVTILLPIIFLLFKVNLFVNEFRLGIWTIISIVLGILAVVGTLWSFYFKIHSRFWPFLALVFFYVFISYMFLSILFLLPVTERLYIFAGFISLLFLVTAIFYVLVLSLNTMNVNLFYYIPLSDLGETITYLVSTVLVFMFSYLFYIIFLRYLATIIVYKLILFLVLAFIVYFLLGFVFVYYYFAVLWRSIRTALFFAVVFWFLSLWGTFVFDTPLKLGIILASTFFMTIGVFIHDLKNTYSRKVLNSYIILELIILIFLIN